MPTPEAPCPMVIEDKDRTLNTGEDGRVGEIGASDTRLRKLASSCLDMIFSPMMGGCREDSPSSDDDNIAQERDGGEWGTDADGDDDEDGD